MAVTITTAANYWIAPNALTITLNALGEANRIQASVASGAVIMVYMRGIKPADPSDPDTALNGDGLEFDNGHNYRRWPLTISPTYFNSNDEKYIYVAIPRKASVGTDAVVVFPSQKLDIYGYSIKEVPKRNARGQMIDEDGYPTDDITKAVKEEEQDEQLGTDDYWYVWLQGIITETNGTSLRDWDAHCESGYLDSDEAISSLETDWYKWDPISGTVTFLKEIFMDAGSIFSNLKAKVAEIADLNVTNLLDAIKAKIDDIRSHNFEEGLTDGNGFRLTADNGEGNSELEVDFLKVRKKATFMELEIRKETFVGGNQNYSPAGSVIYRVEYLDVNNEPLGYKTKKVPWLLKGFAFLGGPFAGAYHLATKRRVYVGMTDEEWPKCHHFRCYLISDDGTTATRNWWRYGDQAKCQSFNKAATVQSKHDNTYNSGTSVVPDPATPMAEKTKTYASQPVETSYWWRMVTNTGSKLLEDGYVYDFVDFPYEGWDVVIGGTRHRYSEIEKKGFRDPGSGMPMAGDTLVCIGNRIEEDRMNLINLSTTGDDNDPPSIRGYRGIHNFKMERSNQVFKISPEETLFRSKRFYLLNDDDEVFRVPLERGEWEMGQRYHWYDRVSWDGSIWLCVVADEYVWQDANGKDYRELDVTDIDQGEGSFTYYAYDRQIPDLDEDGREDGDLVYSGTDHYYATGKVGSTTVYKIKVYTYLEPSDEHNAVWLCEVSKGTEITRSEIHYAASLDGINHPDDDSDDWKDTIEATGVLAGQYLWTRTTTYYRDKNDPDREPTRTYSVARWGIDGDGISEINSYYLSRLSETPIDSSSDNYPMPDDSGWDRAAANAKWFDAFSACAAANGGVGSMQGWMVWEKTVIIYDKHFDKEGKEDTKPDIITYKSSRIGQDGQIGMEEYYMLAESDDFATVFGSLTPAYSKIGIRWYNQSNPAAERWRLSDTTPNINTQMWSAVRPTYNKDVHGKKVYLWNFEQRVDGMGTQYATKPICIGNHARGIKGVIELYALSASQTPKSASILIPQDLYDKNGYGVIPTSGFNDVQVWGDEKYDRAPTEELPYQWNWTRTLYSAADENGLTYEDHYHVSAVRGTNGEDGAGEESIYILSDVKPFNGTHPSSITTGTVPDLDPDSPTYGQRISSNDKTKDDWVPTGWTDNPQAISPEYPYEFVSTRKLGTPDANGRKTWGPFGDPVLRSNWGKNGVDGDGTEYVFIRTKTNVAPTIVLDDYPDNGQPHTDSHGRSYTDNEFLPQASGGSIQTMQECTDDPQGTSREWPFEWVAKRTMQAPSTAAGTYGQRQWERYYDATAGNNHKMSQWSNYSENAIRIDIDNEMDSVMTTTGLVITAARTVETVVRLYDGNTEVDLSSAIIGGAGISLTGEPAASVATRSPGSSGRGRKLSWAFKKDATMSARYEIGISYTYNGQTYQATFTIVASAGSDIYQLRPTYDKIGFSRTSKNLLDPPSVTLGMNVEKITNQGATKMTVAESGQTVRYDTSTMPDKKTDGSAWPTNGVAVAAEGNVTNVFVAMFDTAGNLLDRETVPVVRDGKNGENTVRLDLDNENDSMLYTGGGTLVSGNVTSTAYMFDGASDVSGSTTFSISAREGCTSSQATISGRVITVTGINAATAKVTVQGVYKDGNNNTHTKTAVLTIKKIVDGDKYDLVITPNAVAYNVTTDSPAASTLAIQVWKISVNSSGGSTRALSAPPSGYAVYANGTALTASSTGTYSYTTDNSAISDVLVKIAKGASSSDCLDAETIPINKSKNGTGMKKINTSLRTYTLAKWHQYGDPGHNENWNISGYDNSHIIIGDTVYLVGLVSDVFDADGNKVSATSYGVCTAINSSTIYMDTTQLIIGGSEGPQGNQGKYEEKQYGRSSSSTSYADAYMDNTLDGNKTWIDRIPVTSKAYPFIWQRSRVYDPADGSYGSWQYVRLTGEPGEPGSPGDPGKWYRYAGIWGVDTSSVTNTEKVGWYVKYGSNWYMNVKADGSANTTTPGAGVEGWDVMNSTFDYYIAKAYFGDYAHLGSFIISGDWMISQYGIKYTPTGTYSNSWDYEYFDKNHPNDWSGSTNFVPRFAVDGKTGKVYMNDAYVKGEIHATSGSFSGTVNASGSFRVVNSSNQGVVKVQAGRASETTGETYVTILDEAGIYSHEGNDGFRLSAGNGLQRYDSRSGTWGPMFAGRRVDMLSYYSSSAAKNLTSTHDFVIADPSSGDFNIYLPISPANGKIITVQCVSQDRSVVVNTTGGSSIITAGDSGSYSSVSVNNYERAEFVAYGNNWYVTRSAWDYGD